MQYGTTIQPISASADLPNTTVELTTWDQVFPRLYTPRILCFATSRPEDNAHIANDLKAGLAYTLARYPTFGATLVDSDSTRGTCSLKLDSSQGIPFCVCDYTTDSSEEHNWTPWNFEELKSSGFSPRMLSDAPIANFDRTVQKCPCPTTKVQVSFVPGGVILAAGFIHRAFDGECMVQFMRLWADSTSRITSGEQPRLAIPSVETKDSLNMESTLGENDIANFPEFTVGNAFSLKPPDPAFKVLSPVLRIGRTEQITLKAEASASSTNDAICCKLWLSINKARMIETQDFQSSNFSLGMNLRPHLQTDASKVASDIDKVIDGNATYRIGVTVGMEEYQSLSLQRAAMLFRESLKDFNIVKFRQLLGALELIPTFDTLRPNYHLHQGPDFFLTTHANFDEYKFDWGSRLGSPTAIRVLALPVEGYGIILPRRQDDALEVMISLNEDAVRRLREDDGFMKYFSFVSD